ncbi:M4 family metallopeptidase [Bradyrhizobium sp. DASA03068]|uniref:M4 family metallopeptidase n=1 Tax=Bradyrhizobium sp. BLXBL-01 TaxID=3395915 RepID=UPI003F70C927
MNETYSDIFGIIVSNRHIPNIDNWKWEMGEDLTETGLPIRDFRELTRFNQPAHRDDYLGVSIDEDHGGVHTNSGIRNKAAFNILTARTGGKQLFTPVEVARLFYTTLVNHPTRTSEFIDSRRGAILATRSLFLSDRHRDQKMKAVQSAFDDVGIVDAGVGV